MKTRAAEQGPKSGRVFIFFILSLAAIFSIVLGLYLILARPLSENSKWYADQAAQLYTQSLQQNAAARVDPIRQKKMQNHARELFLQALSLDPFNSRLWVRFARIEGQMAGTCNDLCNAALDIAVTLDKDLSADIQNMRSFINQGAIMEQTEP